MTFQRSKGLFFFFFLLETSVGKSKHTRYFGEVFIKTEFGDHKSNFAQDFGYVYVCWIRMINNCKTQDCCRRICGWGTAEWAQEYQLWAVYTPFIFISKWHVQNDCCIGLYLLTQLFHLAGPVAKPQCHWRRDGPNDGHFRCLSSHDKPCFPWTKRQKLLLFAEPKNRLCLRKIARGKNYITNTEKRLKDVL